MKKLFLALAAVATIMSASAESPLQSFGGKPKLMRMKQATRDNIVTRAVGDEYLVFGYCNGINTAIGAPGYVMEGAIEIPAELAQEWKGNTITAIRIGFGQSTNRQITAYLTKDLEGYAFIMQQANMTKTMDWNDVVLDEPYTFDGTPFYVGYQAVCGNGSQDYPMGVDWDTENFSEYGDLAALDNEWFTIGEDYGNVCIQILVEGTNNIPRNALSVNDIYLPTYMQVNTPYEGGFLVTNTGANRINDFTYTFSINGKDTKSGTYTFTTPLAPGEFEWIRYEDLQVDATGAVKVVATVTQVNGVANTNTENNTFTASFNCLEKVYPQMVLVEEFTGTWCGNCPWGIMGMEYMGEHYGDANFIGVAVHNGDPMDSPTYVQVADQLSQGSYPNSAINRSFLSYPAAENLETYYQILVTEPALAGIEITQARYSEEDNAVVIDSSIEFAMAQTRANYKLAFVIAENGVGPYPQSNYLAGSKEPGAGEWAKYPAQTPWKFDEVGRYIKDAWGINGSVPSTIAAYSPVTYSTSIPVSRNWKLNNCYVVAMLLNSQGNVVNSAKVDSIENAAAGVEGIAGDVEESFKVFNLQGVKVLETKDASAVKALPAGIYIVNGKKTYIK